MRDHSAATDYQVVDWISHHARANPQTVAMRELPSGRSRSYQQADERIGRLAAHLQSIGVTKGDRVGFLALNSIDILELTFATWRIGGIVLALNFRLTAAELTFIIDDATPKVMVHDRSFPDIVLALRGTKKVETWIETDGEGGDSAFELAVSMSHPRYANA